MMKYITLNSLVLLLVLQTNSVIPEENTDQKQNTAIIEFRKINAIQLDQALNGNKIDGYKVMLCEKEPAGFSKERPNLVSENIEVLVTRDKILRIYAISKKSGIWIYFVFDKETSSKIVTMGENNYKKQIAVILNGKLIGDPLIRGSLKKHLNNENQYVWPLPTHYTSKKEAEEFLNEYNLKLDDYSEDSPLLTFAKVALSWVEERVADRDPVRLEDRDGLVYEAGSVIPFTGKSVDQSPHGQKEESEYRDGKLYGKSTVWVKGGQKVSEIEYRDGKPYGKSIFWYDNGQKRGEGEFRDGKVHGNMTLWYENGQKIRECEYRDGKPHGKMIEWYENGQKKAEGEFRDGETISMKCWNENGVSVPCEEVLGIFLGGGK